MSNDLNIISSSKNEIYTKLLNIAANGQYVTSTSDFANVDFLRSGEFGYVTESLAMLIRDSAFQKTMLYNENFLNTAVMPKSIYNWAKTFNVNCLDATPSCRMATLMISTTDIDKGITNSQSNISDYQTKYGIKESNNFIVIDKSNNLIAGDTYFSLEHSIEIYRSGNTYTAKYCVDEEDVTTEFGDYSNVILPLQYVHGSDGITYVRIYARFYQYKTNTISKAITSSSFLDTKVHEFTYDGQICGLAMTYQKGQTTENVTLKFSNIGTDQDETSSGKTAFYSLVDDGTIEVRFSSNSVSGLPQAGGTLNLKLFETKGSSGNISFSGTAVFLLAQEDYRSIAITADLDSVILTNGIDQSSLSEIKNSIINKLSTRNTIVTENDLNLWFETQSDLLSDLSNSKVTFIKQKDNILKRIFSAYLLLRDGVSISAYSSDSATSASASKTSAQYISCPIPTNTINATYITASDTSLSDASTKTFIISPRTIFSYDYATQSYVNSATTETQYRFVSPFYIKAVVMNGYTKASYFFMEPDDSASLKLSQVNSLVNMDLIPSSVQMTYTDSTDAAQASSISGTYKMRFNMSSSQNLTDAQLSSIILQIGTVSYDITTDAKNIGVKLTPEESDSSTDTEDDQTTTKNYYIEIPLSLTDINNNVPSPFVECKIGTSTSKLNIPETPIISLSIKGNSGSGSTTQTDFDVTMTTNGTVSVFQSLDQVMQSDIQTILTTDGKAIHGFIIKDMPVVANYWMTSSINKEWFRKQLFVYIQMLKENTSKLETNTFFSIKFANTYGISYTYNAIVTNLRLKLKIYLKKDAVISYNGKSISNEYLSQTSADEIRTALETEIRDYIRVLVDKSNLDGALKISKIIMVTQGAYNDYIDHIDFNGLNDTFNQYVKALSLSDSEKLKYTIEYFNLDNTIDSSTKKTNLENDIVFEEI